SFAFHSTAPRLAPRFATDLLKTALDKDAMKMLKRPPVDFVVPAGFALVPPKKDGPVIELVAEDAQFNSVRITLTAMSLRNLAGTKQPAKHDRVKTWKESWLKAVETKPGDVPNKARSMKLGNVKAHGMVLKGTLDGFPVTQTVLFEVKDGWILDLTILTFGKGDRVFVSGTRTFLKKFHLRGK
ncbi:MAG: hypothetical protein O7C98_12435, partial [Planctomycetota bacterium]|nr:hypothetical protein [Planctomycetota bacterium]